MARLVAVHLLLCTRSAFGSDGIEFCQPYSTLLHSLMCLSLMYKTNTTWWEQKLIRLCDRKRWIMLNVKCERLYEPAHEDTLSAPQLDQLQETRNEN